MGKLFEWEECKAENGNRMVIGSDWGRKPISHPVGARSPHDIPIHNLHVYPRFID